MGVCASFSISGSIPSSGFCLGGVWDVLQVSTFSPQVLRFPPWTWTCLCIMPRDELASPPGAYSCATVTRIKQLQVCKIINIHRRMRKERKGKDPRWLLYPESWCFQNVYNLKPVCKEQLLGFQCNIRSGRLVGECVCACVFLRMAVCCEN